MRKRLLHNALPLATPPADTSQDHETLTAVSPPVPQPANPQNPSALACPPTCTLTAFTTSNDSTHPIPVQSVFCRIPPVAQEANISTAPPILLCLHTSATSIQTRQSLSSPSNQLGPSTAQLAKSSGPFPVAAAIVNVAPRIPLLFSAPPAGR
jgi:hypothetical protein